jgi:hypothetical protein
MAYEGFWLDGIGSGQDAEVVFYRHDDEFAGSLKGQQFLDQQGRPCIMLLVEATSAEDKTAVRNWMNL